MTSLTLLILGRPQSYWLWISPLPLIALATTYSPFDLNRNTFGFPSTVLTWISSYLSCRSAYLKFDWHSCDFFAVETGVPQRSSLGPALFSLYNAPLSRLISSCWTRYQQYADDSQLYFSVSISDVESKATILGDCVRAVHRRLLHNNLSLPSKSEVTQFSTCQNTASKLRELSVSGSKIQPDTSVKSRGVTIDLHVNNGSMH